MSVTLEKFVDIAAEIKKMELEMMLRSRFKDIDKIVGVLKKEVEKLVITSKKKLEKALNQYRRSEV